MNDGERTIAQRAVPLTLAAVFGCAVLFGILMIGSAMVSVGALYPLIVLFLCIVALAVAAVRSLRRNR